MKIGLRLPHFGSHCTYERMFDNVRWVEEAGFDSVWVRDHLSFRPHAFEGKGNNILEPFTTLAAIAALTERVKLGTAAITPSRHPLVTSAFFGTLAYIAKGRVIAGIGAGGRRAPFDAIGMPFEKRGKIVEEMLEILRLTWSQNHVSFHGEFYNFDDMTINPRPPADTPIYYAGISKISVRRSIKYCEGWLPSRIPFKILDGLMAYMRELEEQQQKAKRIAISYIPLASIDRDSARAWRNIGIERILGNFAKQIERHKWNEITPTEENLDGMLVVGSPQECLDQLAHFQERGIDEILLDFRNTYDEWEKSLDLLATEVLPHLKEEH